MNKGDLIMEGVSSLLPRHIGWTEGDGSGHENYLASDYFDSRGCYLGPDEHGIEPVFAEMPEQDIKDYIKNEMNFNL